MLALLGVTVLVSTAAACSNGGTNAPDTAAKDQAANQTEAKQTDEAPDPYKKFDPPITMSTIFSADTSTEGGKFPDGESFENNPMHQLFLDTMGINVTAKITTTPGAREDKLQLAITSKDIPDFAYVNQTKLNQLIRGDMVEDLTDAYNKYASANLKQVLEQNDKKLFAPAMRDGKIYALPDPTTIYDYTPVLWVRKDWMDKLKLSAPKTMEDVFAMAKAFTTEDPDGNGKNDTLGLYLDKDLTGLNFMMNAYGVYPDTSVSQANMWIKDKDGHYMNGSTDPGAIPVFEQLSELYKIGAIDKEFAIKDDKKESENIAAGKLGLFFGYFYSPLGDIRDSVRNNPKADWVPFSVPAAAGKGDFVPGTPLNAYGWLYVKKGFAHPEALVTMMNYVTDGYGAPWLVKNGPTVFQKTYEATAKDPKYANKGLNNWMPMQLAGNINWGPEFKKDFEAGDKNGPSAKRADYVRMFQPGVEGWAWKKVYLEGYFKAEYPKVRYSDYSGPPTPTLTRTESILNKEKLESYIAFIMGAKPVSEFNAFADRYNKLGGTKIAEEMSDFDNGKS